MEKVLYLLDKQNLKLKNVTLPIAEETVMALFYQASVICGVI